MAEEETIKVFDFFEYGQNIDFSDPDSQASAIVLNDDTVGNLPTSFTICSTILFARKVERLPYFQIFDKDGKPWFNTYDRSNEIKKFHTNGIMVNGIFKLGFTEFKPVVIDVWDHSCTAVDTVTGHVTNVRKGHIMVDKVMEEFKESSDIRPTSLKERLMLGRAGRLRQCGRSK